MRIWEWSRFLLAGTATTLQAYPLWKRDMDINQEDGQNATNSCDENTQDDLPNSNINKTIYIFH